MKFLKLTLLITFFTLLGTNVNAQEKFEKRADEMVKEMVTKFDANEKLKPTTEQQKLLKEVYLKKLNEIKVIKTEVTEETSQKEKIKEVNKKYAKEIFDTILTKDQKAYLKELKKETKTNE